MSNEGEVKFRLLFFCVVLTEVICDDIWRQGGVGVRASSKHRSPLHDSDRCATEGEQCHVDHGRQRRRGAALARGAAGEEHDEQPGEEHYARDAEGGQLSEEERGGGQGDRARWVSRMPLRVRLRSARTQHTVAAAAASAAASHTCIRRGNDATVTVATSASAPLPQASHPCRTVPLSASLSALTLHVASLTHRERNIVDEAAVASSADSRGEGEVVNVGWQLWRWSKREVRKRSATEGKSERRSTATLCSTEQQRCVETNNELKIKQGS